MTIKQRLTNSMLTNLHIQGHAINELILLKIRVSILKLKPYVKHNLIITQPNHSTPLRLAIWRLCSDSNLPITRSKSSTLLSCALFLSVCTLVWASVTCFTLLIILLHSFISLTSSVIPTSHLMDKKEVLKPKGHMVCLMELQFYIATL